MKRVVFASIFALIIIGAITLGYFYYQQIKMPSLEAISAVPPNAVAVFEIKDVRQSWVKLKENQIWNDLTNVPEILNLHKNAQYLVSALAANEKLNEHFNNHPLIISIHVTKADAFDQVYFISLPKFNQESFAANAVESFMTEKVKVVKRYYEGVTIKEFSYQNGNKSFTYAVSKGVFIGSHTPFLVEDAIRQLKSGTSFKSDKHFSKIYESAGKFVDANLYFNYRMMPRMLSIFTNPTQKVIAERIESLANWTELDVTIKKNSFMFSGFSSVSDSSKFLSTLTGQEPVSASATKIIPRRTALMIHLGISDFSLFYEKLKKFNRAHSTLFDARIDQLNKYYGISFEKKFSEWTAGEMAYIITEPNSQNYTNNVYTLIRARDIALARKSLKEIETTIARKQALRVREELYHGYVISFIELPGLLPALYGRIFEKSDKAFYTTINDYVVFGNQASSVRSFIDDFINGRTLENDPLYKQFAENISTKTNCFAFFNMQRGKHIFQSFATEKLNGKLMKFPDQMNRLKMLGFQAAAEGKLVYSNVYFMYGVEAKQDEVNQLWATQLDTTVISDPQVLKDNASGASNILIQDEATTLFLIDNAGEIKWKKTIGEPIIGKINGIDYFKNNNTQYVFNTISHLHMIDQLGNNIGNYPIKLPAAATTGAAVFDYEKNKEYRIFVPCINNIIYSYQATGKPLPGWLFNQPIRKTEHPPVHFVIQNTDYILISDSEGKVYLTDRKGKVKVDVKERLYRNTNSEVILDIDSLGKSAFVTTDTSGSVAQIYPTGEIRFSRFKSFSSNHSFKYEDLDGDQNREYIFLDGAILEVYNNDHTPRFTFTLPEGNNKLQVFNASNNKSIIGIAARESNEIYLINQNGGLLTGFPISGFSSFTLSDLNHDGFVKLIVTSTDNTISVYNVE